ncbi:MAG: chorismate synthase [Alistipes sp. 58_9_plus]|nr:MAG: chorismate synthase [Alistipes sp. 58_9_plus]
MNSWGNRFRVTLWGESHGAQVGVTIDGVPAGIALAESDFEADLARRRAGAAGTTPRKESDAPHIVSGIYRGFTTCAPLTVEFLNENTRSGDYASLASHPRPSHADWVAMKKFHGYNDPRGGGHFSGRITLALVTAGVVAKKILGSGVTFHTDIIEIGGSTDKESFADIIESARMDRDSVGGVVECRAEGVAAGLGEPFFDSAESLMAHLLFSVPAVKGVEFGSGSIIDAEGHTSTNHAGGIVGGITNGNAIVVRATVKPTASISREQMSFNCASGQVDSLVIKGRHDVCITLRAAVVVESAVAIALADLTLRA